MLMFLGVSLASVVICMLICDRRGVSFEPAAIMVMSFYLSVLTCAVIVRVCGAWPLAGDTMVRVGSALQALPVVLTLVGGSVRIKEHQTSRVADPRSKI